MRSRSVVSSPRRSGGSGIDQSANNGFLRPSAFPVIVSMASTLGETDGKMKDLTKCSDGAFVSFRP